MRFEMELKKVLITADTKVVLDIMNEVRIQHNNIGQQSLGSVAREVDNSLYGKFLRVLEILGGLQLGTEADVLKDIDLDLDAPAFHLCEFYRNYLNTLLSLEISRAANKTEKEKISNRFVLIREILLRTVAHALSIKSDDADHGEKMLAFLQSFIKALNKKEVLLTKSWLTGEELSKTNIVLVTSHREWLELLSAMVKTVKLIHLPLTSISKVLTYLNLLKASIARHIIVFGDPRFIEVSDLSPGWIMTTFLKFEKAVMEEKTSELKTIMEMSCENLSATAWHETEKELTTRQESVVANLKLDPVAKENIRELYKIFNATNLIYLTITQIEILVRVGGWMFVLSDALSFNDLAILVKTHCDRVCTLLESVASPQVLYENRSKEAFIQLVQYREVTREHIEYSNVAGSLTVLESPHVRQQLFNVVIGSLEKVVTYQNNINLTYPAIQLLNNEKLQPLQFHTFAPLPLPLPLLLPPMEDMTYSIKMISNAPTDLKILKFDNPAVVDIFDLIGLRRALVMAAIKKSLLSESIEESFKNEILSCLQSHMANIAIKVDDTPLPKSIRDTHQYKQLRETYFDEKAKKEQQDPNITHKYSIVLQELKQYFTSENVITFIDDWYLKYSDTLGYSQHKFYSPKATGGTIEEILIGKTLIDVISKFGFHFYIWEEIKSGELVQIGATSTEPNRDDRIIHLLYSRQGNEESLRRLVETDHKALEAKFDDEKKKLLKLPLILLKSTVSLEPAIQLDLNNRLVACVRDNNVEYLPRLIQEGADVNYIDQEGYTLLFYAVQYGYDKMVIALLKNGANPNHHIQTKTKYNHWTPLCMALFNPGENNFTVQLSMITALLKNGAQIDHKIYDTDKCPGGNWKGWTPLTIAVHNWQKTKDPKQIVELLVQHGANPYHNLMPDSDWPYHTPFSLNERGKHTTKEQQNGIKAVLAPFIDILPAPFLSALLAHNDSEFNRYFDQLPGISSSKEEEVTYKERVQHVQSVVNAPMPDEIATSKTELEETLEKVITENQSLKAKLEKLRAENERLRSTNESKMTGSSELAQRNPSQPQLSQNLNSIYSSPSLLRRPLSNIRTGSTPTIERHSLSSNSNETIKFCENLSITKSADIRGKIQYTFNIKKELRESLSVEKQLQLKRAIETALPYQRGCTESGDVIIVLILEDAAIAKILLTQLGEILYPDIDPATLNLPGVSPEIQQRVSPR